MDLKKKLGPRTSILSLGRSCQSQCQLVSSRQRTGSSSLPIPTESPSEKGEDRDVLLHCLSLGGTASCGLLLAIMPPKTHAGLLSINYFTSFSHSNCNCFKCFKCFVKALICSLSSPLSCFFNFKCLHVPKKVCFWAARRPINLILDIPSRSLWWNFVLPVHTFLRGTRGHEIIMLILYEPFISIIWHPYFVLQLHRHDKCNWRTKVFLLLNDAWWMENQWEMPKCSFDVMIMVE